MFAVPVLDKIIGDENWPENEISQNHPNFFF